MLKVQIFVTFIKCGKKNHIVNIFLQVLLVGDSDVGKQEILAGLDDGNTEWGSSYATSAAGGAGKGSLYF